MRLGTCCVVLVVPTSLGRNPSPNFHPKCPTISSTFPTFFDKTGAKDSWEFSSTLHWRTWRQPSNRNRGTHGFPAGHKMTGAKMPTSNLLGNRWRLDPLWKHHDYIFVLFIYIYLYTLQGTNMSHLGKRKIIFKSALIGDMLVPRRVYIYIPASSKGCCFNPKGCCLYRHPKHHPFSTPLSEESRCVPMINVWVCRSCFFGWGKKYKKCPLPRNVFFLFGVLEYFSILNSLRGRWFCWWKKSKQKPTGDANETFGKICEHVVTPWLP